MSLRRWEALVGLGGMLVSLLLLISFDVAEAVVLAALSTAWVAGRIRVLERFDVPGAYSLDQARVRTVQAFALWVILIAISAILIAGGMAGWGRDTEGRFLVAACVGLAVLLGRDLEARVDLIWRLKRGGRAEEEVGDELSVLRDAGWEVINNWKRDDGYGNVDHVVRGPAGVFAVETKSGRYRTADLGQAVGNAIWVKHKLHARWVTAILCVNDPEREPAEVRSGRSTVWVIDQRGLRQWLAEQPAR
jgi:hypothetical protein